MNYLKNNKEFLKSFRIDLLELVKNYEKNNRYAKNIEWDEKVGEIRVKQGKKNIYLHSIYNKTREIEQLIKNKSKKCEQVCIFGIPQDEQFSYILNEFSFLQRIFIIVPNVGIFYKWLQHNCLRELYSLAHKNNIEDGEFVLSVADDFDKIKEQFKAIVNVGQHEKIIMLSFVSYENLFPEFFLKICQMTRTALQDKIIMQDTRKLWRNTWLLNNWTILSEKTINVLKLRKIFSEYPCIVVAAGASLEKNINLLANVYDKAIIIAAGTAISILHKNNIKPHFYIGVDGGELCNKIFGDCDNGVPLICSYSFYSPIVKEYKGAVFTFAIDSMDKIAMEFYKETREEILISSGGLSVTNIAHALAVQLGCKKLVFIGQDCCYTGNKLYANGSWAEGSKYANKYNENEREILAKDIYGNKVITSEVLLGMKRSIENFIISKDKICKFFNATEGGLDIIGAINITLKDFIAKEMKNSGEIYSYIDSIVGANYNAKFKEKGDLKNIFAEKYKLEMIYIKNMLIEQRNILKGLKSDINISEKYFEIQRAISLFSEIEKKEIYLNTMRENFILDINEVLMLDTGRYNDELREGLKTVNIRLLEHVQAAIILAEEFLQEREPLKRVIYVR